MVLSTTHGDDGAWQKYFGEMTEDCTPMPKFGWYAESPSGCSSFRATPLCRSRTYCWHFLFHTSLEALSMAPHSCRASASTCRSSCVVSALPCAALNVCLQKFV